MNTQSKHISDRTFDLPTGEIGKLDISLIANILAASSDIVIVAQRDGEIENVIFTDSDLEAYKLGKWAGKNLRETVTIESVPKIERILELAADTGQHGMFQVNHPAEKLDDLPVSYSVISHKDWESIVVVGKDLRTMMQMQQRLVQTQLELESDYRNLQQDESRYRTVFQLSPECLALIDGNQKSIIDINGPGAAFFDQQPGKLVGKPVSKLFRSEDREAAIEAMSEARHSGLPATFTSTPANSAEAVQVTMIPYRESGRANLLMRMSPVSGIAKPVPSQRDDALTDINHLPEAMLVIDTKGMVRNVNEMFLDLVQLPNAALLVGRNANNWIGNSPVDLQVLLSKIREEDRIRGFTTSVRNQLGSDRPVQLSASANRDTGEISILFHDVSAPELPIAIQANARAEEAGGFSELVGRVPMKELVRESLDVIEKMCIETALDQTRNNRAAAAELLGLSRQSLYIKLRKHGLEDYNPE